MTVYGTPYKYAASRKFIMMITDNNGGVISDIF